MDWLIDPRDGASTQRTLSQLTEHLERHAADPAAARAARRQVEHVLSGKPEELGDGLVRLHLDWKARQPWVGLAPVPDPDTARRVGVPLGELVPVERRPRLGDPAAGPLVRVPLGVERRVQATFEGGPPPMADLDIDPRRDGPASVAVALTLAAEVHPNANVAQTATLAGAALADGIMPDGGPDDPAEAARLIAEAHTALGSDAAVVRADDEAIEVTMSRCPFGPGVARSGSLCHVSAGIAGRLGTRVNGRATVVLDESIASGDDQCHLQVWLKRQPEEVHGEEHRWPPMVNDHDGPVPHLDLSLSLPRESGSVPVVRRLAVQALTAFGVTREDVEDVELAITEACANVIDHAADTDSYEVQVELASEECAITVVDQGSGFDATAVTGNTEEHAETGRGMALMRALVDNVAFRSEPRAGAVVHMVKTLRYDHTHPLWRRAARAGTYDELSPR